MKTLAVFPVILKVGEISLLTRRTSNELRRATLAACLWSFEEMQIMKVMSHVNSDEMPSCVLQRQDFWVNAFGSTCGPFHLLVTVIRYE